MSRESISSLSYLTPTCIVMETVSSLPVSFCTVCDHVFLLELSYSGASAFARHLITPLSILVGSSLTCHPPFAILYLGWRWAFHYCLTYLISTLRMEILVDNLLCTSTEHKEWQKLSPLRTKEVPYLLHGMFGRGSFSKVERVTDRKTGFPFAVKRIRRVPFSLCVSQRCKPGEAVRSGE